MENNPLFFNKDKALLRKESRLFWPDRTSGNVSSRCVSLLVNMSYS